MCTCACPQVHTRMPPLFLLEGHTPFSSHQLPSRLPLCCRTPASHKSRCSRLVAGLRSDKPCSPLLEPPEAQSAPLRAPSLPNEPLAHRAQGDWLGLALEPTSQPWKGFRQVQGPGKPPREAKTQMHFVLRFSHKMLENSYFSRSQLFEGSLASV